MQSVTNAECRMEGLIDEKDEIVIEIWNNCRLSPMQKFCFSTLWSIGTNLNNYFDFHVRLSICPFVRFRPVPSAQKLTSIAATVSQNVTDKLCLVCVNSEIYASWVTLRPQLDRCHQGEAKVRILSFTTTWSEFHHLPRVGPKQLCALAHLGCTRAAGTS